MHQQVQRISRISASAATVHQQHQRISRISASEASAHQQHQHISTSAHQHISSISASEASAHQQDRCISKIKLRAKFLSQPQQSLKKDSAPGSYQPLVNLLISPENWNSVVFALTFTLSATVTMVHVVVCDRIGICHPTNPSGLRKRKST